MSIDRNERPLEAGIHTDLEGRLTYGGYLTRFARIPEFRAFQAKVLAYRRRGRHRPSSPAL